MANHIARPAGTLMLALVVATAGAPSLAATHRHAVHHDTRPHPAKTRHGGTAKHPVTSSHHHATRPAARHDAAPSGATRVPAGGIKLFCPARANPLLIRKSTQGAGTTVTLVCH